MTNDSANPLLLSIPLDANRKEHAIVIVRQHQARTPPERLISVLGFNDDRRGGYITAAQASDQRWGYLNESGHWVIAPRLEEAKSFSDDGLARFRQEGYWGYVNLAGELAIAAQFEDARAFDYGLAAVRVGKEQWRFIDVTGKFAFDRVFSRVGSFSAVGLAPAVESRKNPLAGYIDRSGQWAIKPQFKTLLAFGADGVAPASIDGKKYGLIDVAGNWVLAPVYPRIDQFNEDGLAYYDEEDSWYNGHGYLNAKGEVAVKGDRELSNQMVGGIAYADYAGRKYVNKDGQALPEHHLSWGGHFTSFAYAIVRTSDWCADPGRWGLLHADGAFRPVPDEVLEPLTDTDGWIPRPLAGTPYSPFLTKSGGIVFLDRDGVVAFRIRYDSRVTLLDGAGNPLWHSAMCQACQAPAPFFHEPIDAFLDGVTSLEQTIPCAESLLAETEEKLHGYAAGAPVAAHGKEADDDEDDDDDADETMRAERRIVTARRLVRAYAGEAHNGYYEFRSRCQENTVAAAKAICLSALQARFGEPDPDPEYAPRGHRHVDITSAWPIQLRQPVAGTANVLPESRELWLGFYEHTGTGDGDAWDELWLMCAPSIDALEAARGARALAASVLPSPHGKAAHAARVSCLPQTYDEWLAAVGEDKNAIAQAPSPLMDDAMVDAAVAANTGALEYVPPPWQTPARLDALIRQGIAVAVGIPPRCMTQEGLALARALYGDEQEWQWRDESHSALPSTWDQNSLSNVWGALLNEEHCIRAVTSGGELWEVPHWLRTEHVEQAALDADLSNINYIAKDRVTPELIARIVRHDYGSLFADIPEEVLTPQACMVVAGMNGMSLEHLPAAMRSVEACIGALLRDKHEFAFVPDDLRHEVCTGLIEVDLMRARNKGDERIASRWHGHRAWTRLKRADYEGAIADATLAIDGMGYAITASYLLASAYLALGRKADAAMEASTVLSLDDPYMFEFDEDEDTSWLKPLAQGQFDDMDDAALIARLPSHPRLLADIPRARITHQMVDAALAADPGAIAFVPKRLMTSERYAIALREQVKGLANIPQSMLNEAIYIEHVRYDGYGLKHVPMAWRTVQVCAYALNAAPRALEYVPEPLRQAAQEARLALPCASSHDNDDDDDDD